jgi:hypothetical protein
MFEKIKNIFKKEKKVEYPPMNKSIKETDLWYQEQAEIKGINPILKECQICRQKSASSYWTVESGVQIWRYGFCGHKIGREIPL